MQHSRAHSEQRLFHEHNLGWRAYVRRGCHRRKHGCSTALYCRLKRTRDRDYLLYGVTFGATGTMNAGAPAHNFGLGGGPGYEFAPLTEFYNAGNGN